MDHVRTRPRHRGLSPAVIVGATLLLLAVLLLYRVAQSPGRFKDSAALAAALHQSTGSCNDYQGEQSFRGPTIPGADAGRCTVEGGDVTMYVYSDMDLFSQLRKPPSDGDPSPRVWWVVGDNWFVATPSRMAALAVKDALGGRLV